MNVLIRARGVAGLVARSLYCTLPIAGVKNPVFVVGCGRSGTTVLGEILSQHTQVTYLNERRPLWFSFFPTTDLWTDEAAARQGRLILDATDAHPRKAVRLSRSFRFETVKTGRPVLVEKWPVNSYRLSFVHRIFPDARFVYIYRNGLEVAASIAEQCKHRPWFGSNELKWAKLVEYALSADETRKLPSLCESDFDRGLLEWRLSAQAATSYLCRLPQAAVFELSYDQLVDDPTGTVVHLLEYLGLRREQGIVDYADAVVRRRSKKQGEAELSAKARAIGGDLLVRSFGSSGRFIQESEA